MAKDIYDLQADCLQLAAGVRATAREVHEEIGAATSEQGTVDDWKHVIPYLENAGDVLNDLLNNYDEGYDAGYADGEKEGHKEGKEEGRKEAIAEAVIAVQNLL